MGNELTIGTLIDSGAPAHLLAKRMNRHTFWCGQSGSGKTYALGVLLEQLMLQTTLPLVVLDPNSDFVGLGDPVDDAPVPAREAIAARDIRVFRPQGDPGLRVRMLAAVRTRAVAVRRRLHRECRTRADGCANHP